LRLSFIKIQKNVFKKLDRRSLPSVFRESEYLGCLVRILWRLYIDDAELKEIYTGARYCRSR